MGGGDRDAVLLVDRRHNFGETFARVRALAVPSTDRYPDGVKYSMHYGFRDGDTTAVANDDGTIEPVDFPGVRTLAERFKREVSETYDEPWE